MFSGGIKGGYKKGPVVWYGLVTFTETDFNSNMYAHTKFILSCKIFAL